MSGFMREMEGHISIDVSGIHLQWHPGKGTCSFENLPVAMLWVDTTLAGLMSGIQSMVGTERFALALQSQGRKSVDDDWEVISRFPDFEEGFGAIRNIAAVAGWGYWELLSLDEEMREGRFRVRDSWEGRYQKALGECWGSGMLAGKLAGYCSRLFGTNCWADQTAFIAKGDRYDEFTVKPSPRSIEKEIENLLATDEATRADMAVALRTLEREIAERNRAELALKESEEKYRLLYENAGEAIFIAQDGVMKFSNPMTEKITGYSSRELADIPFTTVLHPDDGDMVVENYEKRLRGESFPSTYSFRIISRSGVERTVQLTAVLVSWEGRPASLNFVRDITEQKRMEEQFQAAQRLEALGTLAGGIAHDFNNLLMGIEGSASLMLEKLDSSHPFFEHLRGIEEYVQSAADLTRQLLGVGRGGKYEVCPTNPNDIIEKSIALFGRAKKELRIHRRLCGRIWTADVDQGQIHQVLMNLYVNAWQAMNGRGDLRVTSENVTLEEASAGALDIGPGRYVRISVADSGIGMDEVTRRKLFEPFFTTKSMGRGTGLGLAAAYGIVKNHGGAIDVESRVGEGSVFSVYLPASSRSPVRAKRPDGKLLKGTGTLLLVDDEEAVLTVTTQMLTSLGYEVLTAGCGRDAVRVFREHRDAIDLVILDMIMPDVSCGMTFDRIRVLKPSVKVLLASGYALDGEARSIIDRGCNGFIQKPYSMTTLSRRIRDIIDEG